MSQTTQRPPRPKSNKPKKKNKKKQQRPKKVQPTYVSITQPKMIMNPATLRTTTRRTPAVSSTLSPETIMMNEMRNKIMESNGGGKLRPIPRQQDDGLGILDLFPEMILTTTPRSSEVRTTTTRPIRFPHENNPPPPPPPRKSKGFLQPGILSETILGDKVPCTLS